MVSCLKQRNNWSTEAGEWQTARTTQETREGDKCSHCMLQSALEQHAFTVSEPRWVEKMKEMDRAFREEEAHIQWLEREGTYISIPESLQQLYISFVRVHLDYAAPVWDFQLQTTWINLRRTKVCSVNVHKVLIGWKWQPISSFNIPFLKNRRLYLKSLASEWSTCWFCRQYQIFGAGHFSWFFSGLSILEHHFQSKATSWLTLPAVLQTH